MFATLPELKTYLAITTQTEDAKLTNLLNMANQFVSDYTNISTEAPMDATVDIVDYLPLPNNRLVVDELNLDTVEKVLVNGAETDVTGSIVRGYMIVLSKEVSGTVAITCKYKTTAEQIPGLQALKVAVMELAKFYHKQEYKSSIQQGGEAINFDSVSYIPSHVKSILDLYRR